MEILLLVAVLVLAWKLSDLSTRLRKVETRLLELSPPVVATAAASLPTAVPTAVSAAPEATSDEFFVSTFPAELPEASEDLQVARTTFTAPVPTPPLEAPKAPRSTEPVQRDNATPEWSLVDLLKQNLFAVAGICLLLLGFTFLFRSIQWGELLPPWARITLAYAATAGLAWAGVRWSDSKPLWAQIAQGGAAGVAYLATYIAATRYGLFTSGAAMALFALISLSLVGRALIENSKVLAAIGFLGAYAAPMLALDGGGPLAFNLSYGLLVTAFALWISYLRNWMEIAVHAHLCAAGLAVITYNARAEPLAPWLQQTLLHGYLAQLLLWSVGWSRRWLALRTTATTPDQPTAILVTCLCATALCYLALQSWLVPQELSFVAVAFAALLTALGFLAFRERRFVQEATWVLAVLSVAVAFNHPDLSTIFKGLGLLLEGTFLTLTVRRPGSVRAVLGRLLIGAGALVLLTTESTWALGVLLLATMALALWSSRESADDASAAHGGFDEFFFAALSVASLGALTAVLSEHRLVPWLAMFTGGSALQAGIACWRGRVGTIAPALFLGTTASSWIALAVLPDKSQPELQLVTLTAVLVVGVAGAWLLAPREDAPRLPGVAAIGSLLVLLLPALFVYKLSDSLILLTSAVALGLAANVWITNLGVLGRAWRLQDDSALRGLATPIAHLLAALAFAMWVSLSDMRDTTTIVLALVTFLVCLGTWTVHGNNVDAGLRHVFGASFAVVGLFGWTTAALEESTQGVMRSTMSSQLLPVLLTTVAVGFLFHASRTGQRTTWGAAALVCAASCVKLVVSLGSALLSPVGVAASLLGMGSLLLLAGYVAPLPPEEKPQGR